jgi:hypothetical protein
MRLLSNWQTILQKAWSIRLMILAGVLTAIESILPLYIYDFPRGVAAALSLVVIVLAFVTRLLAQKGVTHEE